MTFVWAILIGLVLGAISAMFGSRRDPGSIIVRAIVGIFCGLVAGIAAIAIAPGNASNDLPIAIIGVVILLALYSVTLGRRKKK